MELDDPRQAWLTTSKQHRQVRSCCVATLGSATMKEGRSHREHRCCIQRALGAGEVDLPWFRNAYTLAFGALVRNAAIALVAQSPPTSSAPCRSGRGERDPVTRDACTTLCVPMLRDLVAVCPPGWGPTYFSGWRRLS
jgi:hypothetical protein